LRTRAETLFYLSRAYTHQQRWHRADNAAGGAVEANNKLGDRSWSAAWALANYGDILGEEKQFAKALEAYQKALDLMVVREKFANTQDHKQSNRLRISMIQCWIYGGQLSKAEANISAVLASIKSSRPIDPAELPWSLDMLCRYFWHVKQYERAIYYERQAYAAARQNPTDTKELIRIGGMLCDMLNDRHHKAEADKILSEEPLLKNHPLAGLQGI
jgi:tetratricopeptide (TPR) repeat protein